MRAFTPRAKLLGVLAIVSVCACMVSTRVSADERDKPKPLPKAAAPAAISNIEELPELPLALAGTFGSGPATLPPQDSGQPSAKPLWHYGGFFDLGYLLDFNHPANHVFRDRGTTPRVNELDLNMAALYLSKEA